MWTVISGSWALLLGILLLMLGNGMQSTLLGVRGAIEGFSPAELSVVMSAYFAGFLLGSRAAPLMIRRVGHVRVFAALGSFISAILVLFPALPDPVAWTVMRVVIGFSFAGVYVVAESWLNDGATNETRGQALSLYVIVQMAGIIAAQGLLVLGDPADFILFIIPSVLVSLAFAPILLSVSPAPVFATTKPMTLRALYGVSPLGLVGSFLMGGVFAATYAMAAVFGTEAGLSVAQISLFVATIYTGGLVCLYPIGWLSDRIDRRVLIAALAGGCALVMAWAVLAAGSFTALLVIAFVIGGVSNPLYALFIAYTNDFLDPSDMAAASGGLIFANGLGAVSGPLLLGWLMNVYGASAFFGYVGVILAVLSGYAVWRMTRRPTPSSEETYSYTAVAPLGSIVSIEAAQEATLETMREDAETAEEAAALEAGAAGAGPAAAETVPPER